MDSILQTVDTYNSVELFAQKLFRSVIADGTKRIAQELRLVQLSMQAIEQPGEEEARWVNDARLVFREIEDAIELFVSRAARDSKRGNLKKPLLQFAQLIKLRAKVDKIRVQIHDVSDRRPTKLKNSKALVPSPSQRVCIAVSAVSCAVDKINIVLSEKLISHLQVRKKAGHIRSEFALLHDLILDEMEPGKHLDRRAIVWLEQVEETSLFTDNTFSSFNQRKKLLITKRVLFLKAAHEERIFGDEIDQINLRVETMYKRKWLFGIGGMKKSSTPIVSMSRRGPLYCTINRNPPPPYLPGHELLRCNEELEQTRVDLRLLQALLSDVKGIEENLDRRVVVWLGQMREIAEYPATKDLADSEKTKTLMPRRIIEMKSEIADKLFEMSERKWTYDILEIEGGRYNTSDDDGLEGLSPASSGRRRGAIEDQFNPTLVHEATVKWLGDELELMNALIEEAKPLDEQLDERLKVWVKYMEDIAADTNELIQKYTELNIRGFTDIGIIENIRLRQQIARDIDMITSRIVWISRRKWMYDIGRIQGQRPKDAAVSERIGQWQRRPLLGPPVISNTLHTRSGEALDDLERKVESMRRESSLIHALLIDIATIEKPGKRFEAWRMQMTRVADEIDLAIDDYSHNMPTMITSWKAILNRFRIGMKIKRIQEKTYDMESRMGHDIQLHRIREPLISSMSRYPSAAVPFSTLGNLKIIGNFSDFLHEVMGQSLIDGDEHFTIISVVGMKGVGKTVLAELIYGTSILTSYFASLALVTLSPDIYDSECLNRIVEEALQGLLKQKEGDQTEVDCSKKVLIILDEVRTTKIWDVLIRKLRNILDGRRCVVLFTSCDISVAVHANPKSIPHKLELLNDDDSWALFTHSLTIPDGLIDRTRKWVMKCGGLPRMLMEAREQFLGLDSRTDEWMKVLNTLNLDQMRPWRTTPEGLPESLWHCVFYLSRFPADFVIPLRRLSLLLYAEGILHQWWDDDNDFDSPESVAESYLTELADRCLVQVTKRDLHGAVKKCRLPHGLRELLSSKSKIKVPEKSNSNKILHLTHYDKKEDALSGSIHCCIADLYASALSDYRYVITFRSFDSQERNQPGQDLGEFLYQCISEGNFLLMRVLDLEHVFKPVLPKALGELVHLKYLGLRWTYLESLPTFMSELLSLQILDLKHTSISTLPNSIWKMGQLRYLFLDEANHCRFVPRPSRYSLPHLQTLWNVFIDEDSPVNGGLDSLTNLKRLGVECRLMSSREGAMLAQLDAVANWVETLKELKSLRLKSFDKCGKPWNIPLKTLSGQKKLGSLYLLGRVEKDLVKSGLPSTLTELTLSGSGLEDDPMQLLKELSNLRSFRLFSDSFVGKKMVCSEGFAQLRFLKIWKLDNLEEWKVESGALPTLEDLEVRSCKRLKMFPDELRNSKTLRKLNFRDMPKEWDEICKNLSLRRGENVEDKDEVVNTPALMSYPTDDKIVQLRNEAGEPSHRRRARSGNISTSSSAREISYNDRPKSCDTATSLSSGAFVPLQILKIQKLDKQEDWKAERAFLMLTDLDIRSCKGNDENFADKYGVAHMHVSIMSSINDKIDKQILRRSQKLFLKKIASEILEIHPWECSFCGIERESLVHLFFLCKHSKMIWFSNCGIRTDYFSDLSISEWINHILTPSLLFGGILPNQADFISSSATLLETIWSWRNRIVSGAAEVFHPDMVCDDSGSTYEGEGLSHG